MHNPIVGGVLLAIHLLSIVTWVGGMFFAITVLRPSMGVIDAPQRVALHAQVFRRFFLVIWHAMPLALLSGFGMVFAAYGGFAGLNWSIQAMMGLGIVMALVFLAAFLGPWKRMRRAISTAAAAAAADRIRKLILLNLALGLIVVAIAGFGRFYF